MTTVKDLILALQKFPMNAPVFIYSVVGECDGMVDKVTCDVAIAEQLEGEDTPFACTPYYCQDDSEAEQYWSSRGLNKPIVFLHSTNTIHDFTID
jgi:hypothetical protein